MILPGWLAARVARCPSADASMKVRVMPSPDIIRRAAPPAPPGTLRVQPRPGSRAMMEPLLAQQVSDLSNVRFATCASSPSMVYCMIPLR